MGGFEPTTFSFSHLPCVQKVTIHAYKFLELLLDNTEKRLKFHRSKSKKVLHLIVAPKFETGRNEMRQDCCRIK